MHFTLSHPPSSSWRDDMSRLRPLQAEQWRLQQMQQQQHLQQLQQQYYQRWYMHAQQQVKLLSYFP